jgi:hypothetical protein
MAIVTTHRRRQPSLLDPEPPPPGGFVPPAGRDATRPGPRALRTQADRELTPAAPDTPVVRSPAPEGAAAAPLAASPHRETLEDLIAATWGGLQSSHTAACPMCGGDLAPRYSAGARPVGGRCRSCGTELGYATERTGATRRALAMGASRV